LYKGFLPAAKFTLRPSLALSYIGSVTARHSQWASSKLCSVVQGVELLNFHKRALPVFGRVTITLGISPHSSILGILISAIARVVILQRNIVMYCIHFLSISLYYYSHLGFYIAISLLLLLGQYWFDGIHYLRNRYWFTAK